MSHDGTRAIASEADALEFAREYLEEQREQGLTQSDVHMKTSDVNEQLYDYVKECKRSVESMSIGDADEIGHLVTLREAIHWLREPRWEELVREILPPDVAAEPYQLPHPEPAQVIEVTPREARLLWEMVTMVDLDTLNDNLARVHNEETGQHELTQLMELLDPDEGFSEEWDRIQG